jgi:uncharacterized membrane protein
MSVHPTLCPVSQGTSTPHAVVNITRWLSVGSLCGLIVLGLLWELWLARTGSGSLALKVLPLAIPLAGLLKHKLYTHRWVSLLVWIYFTEGVVRATTEPMPVTLLASIEVFLCLVLFISCACHVRWRLGSKPVQAP